MPPTQGPDFRALIEDAPGLYLVLSPEFKIVAATNAYLRQGIFSGAPRYVRFSG